jgi:hypothetical protein
MEVVMIASRKDQEDTWSSEPLRVLTCMGAVIVVVAMTGWASNGLGPVAGKSRHGPVVDSCSGGDEVTRFVCRNTWLSHHKSSYR